MKPDLVSFAAGGNDVLRRSFDPSAMVERFDGVVAELRAAGADVVLFRFADVMARLPGQRLIAPRVAFLNAAVGETAQRHGALLVDLFADDEFHNPRAVERRPAAPRRRPGTAGSPATCSPRST